MHSDVAPATVGVSIPLFKTESVRRRRELIWTTAAQDRRALRRDGYHVVEYARFKRRVMAARAVGTNRSGLGNPAAGVLSIFARHDRIAVLGVDGGSPDDLFVIYAYLIEPAFGRACTLLLAVDEQLAAWLAAPTAPEVWDVQWRYPWTWERVMDRVGRGSRPVEKAVVLPVNRWRRIWWWLSRRPDVAPVALPGTRLDAEQLAAVRAGDGVVQVIAPAGSGKTTVLIERVKELQRRGTDAKNILCLSFNRAAKVEIGERLERAGVAGVVVRSFHGLGLAILKEEGVLGQGLGCIEDAELAGMIQADPEFTSVTGLKVDEVREAICNFKLAAMIGPDAAIDLAAGPRERLIARVYGRYVAEMARRSVVDFDDLVAGAVGLLQRDAAVRYRWQARFQRVLVDEYQDIEPVQALLVGILAAPQDSLFCVGDEDQCIYAWRRATVQRIIALDQVYPGLERHALIRNYRCGRRITRASRLLIEHNRVRFRKPLRAGARQDGEIVLGVCEDRAAGARLVAHLISDAVVGETVVLARTARLLAEVAAAQEQLELPSEVELVTIHGAKGREWSRVILYGVDEGQIPHRQALVEGGLEDERRLFYVALTRAQDRVEIVCSEGRESRFLEEARIL